MRLDVTEISKQSRCLVAMNGSEVAHIFTAASVHTVLSEKPPMQNSQ